ncbi:MAG: FAD-dependent oxidoreductase [Pseudolabrys sp.]|jgi:glycine/D-amino acid oxidase-like deaminating enzyme|nr:FAD-dependent oxidoreductase [Pseudolabrys sp.]
MNASGPRPSWYETTQVADEQRPRLNFDLDVDVCVIGGGLAGLTAAREVARRGWSVAMLEAGRIAAAASGRSNGFVLPGYSEEIDPMVERIGLDHAKELWALSQRGVDYVRHTIAETAMPGVEIGPGWLRVAKTDNWHELLAYVERLRWMGGEVEAWPVERVREVLPSERYFGAIHYPGAFHLHPLNYALGLARSAEALGARIFEETPAIELDPAGILKRVQTPSARVRARHVVLAANVQLGALVPKLAATLMPITTYVMVTEPIEGLTDVVRFRGAVSDTRRFDNHYRVVDGNRLQWSGCMTTWSADPRRFARALTASVKRVFPQLGSIRVADLWSGTLGRTLHHMPQIGEIEPGVWVTSGFGRHGLNTASLAGDLVARGIVDNDQTWRLFAPYELVWAGGKLFRAIAQGLYAAGKPFDGFRQSLSRYRERSHKRRSAHIEAKRLATALGAAPLAAGERDASVPSSGAAPMRHDPEPLPAAGSSRGDER